MPPLKRVVVTVAGNIRVLNVSSVPIKLVACGTDQIPRGTSCRPTVRIRGVGGGLEDTANYQMDEAKHGSQTLSAHTGTAHISIANWSDIQLIVKSLVANRPYVFHCDTLAGMDTFTIEDTDFQAYQVSAAIAHPGSAPPASIEAVGTTYSPSVKRRLKKRLCTCLCSCLCLES